MASLVTGFAEGKNDIKKVFTGKCNSVTTIDPDATCYLNWEEIGNAIENSINVMFGEQDH